MSTVGEALVAFFEDHLKVQKGLRPGSVRSYRDTLKLFLAYIATSCRRPITRLTLLDLSFQRVLDFLGVIESVRGNKVRTRNQRLAALRTFYRYLATRHSEMLVEAERVEAIPTKRTSPPETHYLERDEIDKLFSTLPKQGSLVLRDRALLLLLYNSGARVQEVADLRVGDVDLDGPFRVRLHGKGEMAKLSALAANGGSTKATGNCALRRQKRSFTYLPSAQAFDTIRNLQTRQTPHRGVTLHLSEHEALRSFTARF